MTVDIKILKNEIDTDPINRSYSGMSHQAVADSLNNTIDQIRNKTSMTGREVAAKIVNTAYNSLSEDKKSQVLSLVSSDSVDPFGFAENVIKDIFGSASATTIALSVARTELVSRPTILGFSTVKEGHVMEARA